MGTNVIGATALGLVVALVTACATDSAQETPDEPAAAPPAKDDVSYTAAGHKHGQHRFDDVDEWVKRFEDPSRDAWQQPEQVIDWLKLAPTAKVADIGAATGYFPVRIAKRIPAGRVYGIDIEPTMVTYLNKRATSEGLTNLTAVLGAPADPKIPELVDVVLLVNTYHHIEDRTAYFARLRSQTTKDARLVVVDFKQGDLGMGPPEEMKLAPEVVIEELRAAGWMKIETHELSMQYVLLFAQAAVPAAGDET